MPPTMGSACLATAGISSQGVVDANGSPMCRMRNKAHAFLQEDHIPDAAIQQPFVSLYPHRYVTQALDILTPLGRGQAQLLTGPPGSGKSACALDAVLGQAGTGVRCIMAVLGRSPAELEALDAKLRKAGALDYTTVVSAPAGGQWSLP